MKLHHFKVETDDGDRKVAAHGFRVDPMSVTFYLVPDWNDRTRDERLVVFNRDRVRCVWRVDPETKPA